MLKKISIFLSFILALNLPSYISYADEEYVGVETIKQEDEYLLDTSSKQEKHQKFQRILKHLKNEADPQSSKVQDTTKNKPQYIFPTKKERQKSRTEEKEWFKSFSSLQDETKKTKDPRFKEFKEAINACYDNHKQSINLEKSFLRNGNIYKNASFLSQTFEKINSCYEGMGLDIISTFYNNDTTMLENFNQEAKTFYVKGADASFSGRHCDETCSFEAIIDEQISKFEEFKSYLFDLLKQKEGK